MCSDISISECLNLSVSLCNVRDIIYLSIYLSIYHDAFRYIYLRVFKFLFAMLGTSIYLSIYLSIMVCSDISISECLNLSISLGNDNSGGLHFIKLNFQDFLLPPHTNGLVYGLILMVCQPFYGYFMPWCLGIAFVFTFLRSCFLWNMKQFLNR